MLICLQIVRQEDMPFDDRYVCYFDTQSELYGLLLKERNQLSNEMEVSQFHIASNKSLLEMAAVRFVSNQTDFCND